MTRYQLGRGRRYMAALREGGATDGRERRQQLGRCRKLEQGTLFLAGPLWGLSIWSASSFHFPRLRVGVSWPSGIGYYAHNYFEFSSPNLPQQRCLRNASRAQVEAFLVPFRAVPRSLPGRDLIVVMKIARCCFFVA
jgi:hypothetical protein